MQRHCLGRGLYRKVGRLLTLKNTINIAGRLPVKIDWVRPRCEMEYGTYWRANPFRLEVCYSILNSHRPRTEHTMNIFYIIGVVVVVLLIAGFLGLRV